MSSQGKYAMRTGRRAVRRAIRFAAASLLAASLAGAISVAPAGASPSYPSVIKQDSPFAYWQLADSPGSATAKDSSGHGNSGTYAQCVGLGRDGPFQDYDATAAFLGQRPGCYLTYTPSAGYYGSYTVEAWVNPSTTTKYYQTFFDSRSTTGENSVDFKLWGSSAPGGQQLCADIGDGYEWLANPCTPFAFRAHRWYYLALTVSETGYNDGVATFFVDGRAVYEVGLPNYGSLPLLTDSDHPIAVGGNPRYDNNPYPENFDGTIGQVAVYEYALSSSQVAAHYSAGEGQ